MVMLVWHDDPRATRPELAGAKFAMLAVMGRWPAEDRPQLVGGAVLTTDAWRAVVEHAGLRGAVQDALGGDESAARRLSDELVAATLPQEVLEALGAAVEHMDSPLAVRSSAVAEDLAGRSFAGQYLTRLSVVGREQVADAYRACLASAWDAGARAYRVHTGGEHRDDPAMAVALQPMVHAGDGWAGAVLSDGAGGATLEVVRGLGDDLMSGRADPLRWTVAAGEDPEGELAAAVVSWVRRAERRMGHPVEVEFAVRPRSAAPTVLQLRPHRPAVPTPTRHDRWHHPAGTVTGLAVGAGRVVGRVCRLEGPEEMDRMVPGGILVTTSTDPSWLPLLAGAGAVVTDHGGLTSHAAIVCRELGLLAVVGCGDATRRLIHGQAVEVRCDGPDGAVGPPDPRGSIS